MKSDISTSGKWFKTHQSYTPEEVLAAGGTTAFGRKAEKKNIKLIQTLENAPPIEPFTKEEWDNMLIQLDKDK